MSQSVSKAPFTGAPHHRRSLPLVSDCLYQSPIACSERGEGRAKADSQSDARLSLGSEARLHRRHGSFGCCGLARRLGRYYFSCRWQSYPCRMCRQSCQEMEIHARRCRNQYSRERRLRSPPLISPAKRNREAAKRRKNAAHGASRGYSRVQDKPRSGARITICFSLGCGQYPWNADWINTFRRAAREPRH